MFSKILIANRGEIACRVAATARRLGVRTVAVYSEADAHAQHVKACDEAVCIGGPLPKESYLRADAILEVAKRAGAQAVHPGYGFLSENESFADACKAEGIAFIGPPASAIEAMGLKAQSKQLMERAGVPLVPGYHGADQDPALLKREATKMGYPVLIKASAGGGGKGMRIVNAESEFDAALASCKREAIQSFGDDAVLVERYVTRPRHIEIQVFCDTLGNGVYLFERDCSVQRRHQKVLEEAPAPGMTEERRKAMGEAAVAAATAVGYVGAGTVEFIVEQDGRFYFMEMNTRLQVEHPVTEAITGFDLVEWQLRVACGEPLPCLQADLRRTGHAIEARICAEKPEKNFLPATGRLNVFKKPAHVAFERGDVRIDAGVSEGDEISPYYDSMIAKLIVWGADRGQALARMDEALAQLHIAGVANNVAFLRRVIRTESFSKPDLDTGLIEREREALFGAPVIRELDAVAAAVAFVSQAAPVTNPWMKRDGWRMNADAALRFEFEIGESTRQASYSAGVLQMGEMQSQLSLSAAGNAVRVASAEGVTPYAVYQDGSALHVFSREGYAELALSDAFAHAGEDPNEAGRLTAPMPGKVIALLAKAGDSVKKGQALAVMEAMKMEHTIAAPVDGVVAELPFAVGEQVTEGAELVRFAAPA
jgi:3-methylcrotonyl-CoA carboxylase alpha subunit